MRYLMKKYNLPKTDPRLLAYTPEDAILEYLEDAIENDKIPTGSDGKPMRKIMYRGTEIYKTGDPMFDAFEREWAEQDVEALDAQIRDLVAVNAEPEPKDDVDVLRELGYTPADILPAKEE